MTSVSMTPRQIELARHALGLPNEKRQSYRNRFCAASGTPNDQEWRRMVDAGFAICVPRGWGGGDLFKMTFAGAKSVLQKREGLDPEDFGTTA